MEVINNLNVETKIFSANFLSDPEKMVKDNGESYQVFTPYWRNILKKNIVREQVKKPAMNGVKFYKDIVKYDTQD